MSMTGFAFGQHLSGKKRAGAAGPPPRVPGVRQHYVRRVLHHIQNMPVHVVVVTPNNVNGRLNANFMIRRFKEKCPQAQFHDFESLKRDSWTKLQPSAVLLAAERTVGSGKEHQVSKCLLQMGIRKIFFLADAEENFSSFER